MEWISVKDRLPDEHSEKFRVRLSTSDELDAYFCLDAMAWIAMYGHRLTHWWKSTGDHDPLYNVTHWRDDDHI
jgi:hypothetical protein